MITRPPAHGQVTVLVVRGARERWQRHRRYSRCARRPAPTGPAPRASA